MTSKQTAAACDVSQRQLFVLKNRFPKEVPASFNDVDDWKKFVDAHRVVVAAKRHAPRSDAGLQSDHAKYIHFRALKTATLAEAEAIKLAVVKRSVIDKAECERAFAQIGCLMRGQMMRLMGDLPCQCAGLDAPAIEQILRDKFGAVMNNLTLPAGFLEPQKQL
jgi:hypothetical protein